MALKIAERSRVPPFIVMDVMRAANERAASGQDVLHLEVGQPSTGAPQGVLDAVRRSLPNDPMGYTDALGLPALRRRIAEHYREAYGVVLDPERVVVLPEARTRIIDATSLTTRHGEQSIDSTCILPASILDRSRMSLMIEIRCSPLRRMMLM